MTEHKTTALVTGASSGIGAEFCRQLAQSCPVIIAVARSAGRLEELARELASHSEVHVVEADLTTEEGLARTVEALRQKGPVDYLVNNAGFGTSGDFDRTGIDRQQDMVDLHIRATLRLCHAAVPFMRELGGGRIVNVSSLGSFIPARKMAVYNATKAFVTSFSRSLQEEVAGDGIRVQALCPGYTRTAFTDTPELAHFDPERVPQEMWMDAGEVVAQSLAALEEGPAVLVTGEVNRQLAAGALQALQQELAQG